MVKKFILFALSAFLVFSAVSLIGAADETLPSVIRTVAPSGHEAFMRQAFDLAISAGKKGNHPFGAVLVHRGKVIMAAENTVNTDNDCTRHAEVNLLVKARRELSREVFRQSTLYTSATPCMFCCSAMWYSGVSRVVYGVSGKAISRLTDYEEKSMPCDALYQSTGRALEWIGPVLEEEGLRVFCHWPDDSFRSSLIKKLETLDGIGRPCK